MKHELHQGSLEFLLFVSTIWSDQKQPQLKFCVSGLLWNSCEQGIERKAFHGSQPKLSDFWSTFEKNSWLEKYLHCVQCLRKWNKSRTKWVLYVERPCRNLGWKNWFQHCLCPELLKTGSLTVSLVQILAKHECSKWMSSCHGWYSFIHSDFGQSFISTRKRQLSWRKWMVSVCWNAVKGQ